MICQFKKVERMNTGCKGISLLIQEVQVMTNAIFGEFPHFLLMRPCMNILSISSPVNLVKGDQSLLDRKILLRIITGIITFASAQLCHMFIFRKRLMQVMSTLYGWLENKNSYSQMTTDIAAITVKSFALTTSSNHPKVLIVTVLIISTV